MEKKHRKQEHAAAKRVQAKRTKDEDEDAVKGKQYKKWTGPDLSPAGNWRPPLALLIHTKVPTHLTAAERERIVHPYLPGGGKPNLFGRHVSLSTPPPASFKKDDSNVDGNEDDEEENLDFDGDIIDAETGEVVMPTKAKWGATEGRLNFDRATLLMRGTGELDVLNVAQRRQREEDEKILTEAREAEARWDSMDAILRAAAGPSAAAAAIARSQTIAKLAPRFPHPSHAYGAQHQPLPSPTSPQRRTMNDLVARFLRDGPIKPMAHRFWDPEKGEVVLPPGYVNDEDGDAPTECEQQQHFSLPPIVSGGDDQSVDSSSLLSAVTGMSGSTSLSGGSKASKARRETPEERKERWKREKQERLHGKKAALDKLVADNNAPKEERPPTPPPVQRDIVISDASTIESQLGDKLDPNDEKLWKAMELRFYKEICDHALEYEKNKWRTKERRMLNKHKGKAYPSQSVRAMDDACKSYASWRARSLRNLVSSIDEEQRRDAQRIELEDQILDEYKLSAQVKKHDEERHQHRLFVRAFRYEMEILTVRKLYDMGIVW